MSDDARVGLGRTIVHRMVNSTLVVVQGDSDVSDRDWREYISTIQAAGPRLKAIIVVTGFGTIDATQRKEFARLLKDQRCAVVSDSTAAKIVTKAIGWLGYQLRNFGTNQLDAAASYVYLDRPILERVIAELREELGSLSR